MVKKIQLFLLVNMVVLMLAAPVLAFAAEDPDMTATPPGTASTADARCQALMNLLNIKYDNPALQNQEQNVGNLASGLPQFCTIESLLFRIINILLTLSAIVAVIFIMIGGFWYLSSAGNEETAEKGRRTLMYAVIGLVIVIMAFTIVRILANTLTSGTAGGSSADTTATAGGGGGGGSVNPQGVISAPITSVVSAQGPFSVIATVRADKADQLTQICGGDPESCSITVEVKGQQKAQSIFSRNTTQFVANASVPGPFTPGDSLDVVVKVNSIEVSSGSVTVSGGGGNGGSQFGQTDINNAVSRASFSTYNDTANSKLIVNLQVSSTDVNIICSATSNKTIKLSLNGQEVASQPITVRQFPITLTGSTIPTVSISICGYSISGSQ